MLIIHAHITSGECHAEKLGRGLERATVGLWVSGYFTWIVREGRESELCRGTSLFHKVGV